MSASNTGSAAARPVSVQRIRHAAVDASRVRRSAARRTPRSRALHRTRASRVAPADPCRNTRSSTATSMMLRFSSAYTTGRPDTNRRAPRPVAPPGGPTARRSGGRSAGPAARQPVLARRAATGGRVPACEAQPPRRTTGWIGVRRGAGHRVDLGVRVLLLLHQRAFDRAPRPRSGSCRRRPFCPYRAQRLGFFLVLRRRAAACRSAARSASSENLACTVMFAPKQDAMADATSLRKGRVPVTASRRVFR
jgi:hypothetical protein